MLVDVCMQPILFEHIFEYKGHSVTAAGTGRYETIWLMTSRDTGKNVLQDRPGSRVTARLHGIDAARGLALLGMMATHLLPTFESNADLTPTWIGLTFSGRAAALFAVLAGVGLALSTGKHEPLQGPDLSAARRGIALRALVIAAVGLSLGGLEVNLAIILVHYAVLFLCVLPFLGLGLKAPVRLGRRLDPGFAGPGVPAAARGCWPPNPPLQAGPQPLLGGPRHARRACWRTSSSPATTPSSSGCRTCWWGSDRGPAGAEQGDGAGGAAGRRHRRGRPGQGPGGRGDGELGRPGGAGGRAERTRLSAGQRPAGQPHRDSARRGPGGGWQSAAPHSATTLDLLHTSGGGGRRGGRVPAAGQAGRMAGPGPAAAAAGRRSHDPDASTPSMSGWFPASTSSRCRPAGRRTACTLPRPRPPSSWAWCSCCSSGGGRWSGWATPPTRLGRRADRASYASTLRASG